MARSEPPCRSGLVSRHHVAASPYRDTPAASAPRCSPDAASPGSYRHGSHPASLRRSPIDLPPSRNRPGQCIGVSVHRPAPAGRPFAAFALSFPPYLSATDHSPTRLRASWSLVSARFAPLPSSCSLMCSRFRPFAGLYGAALCLASTQGWTQCSATYTHQTSYASTFREQCKTQCATPSRPGWPLSERPDPLSTPVLPPPGATLTGPTRGEGVGSPPTPTTHDQPFPYNFSNFEYPTTHFGIVIFSG